MLRDAREKQIIFFMPFFFYLLRQGKMIQFYYGFTDSIAGYKWNIKESVIVVSHITLLTYCLKLEICLRTSNRFTSRRKI